MSDTISLPTIIITPSVLREARQRLLVADECGDEHLDTMADLVCRERQLEALLKQVKETR